MIALSRLVGPALRGVRANLVPGAALQIFALLVVVSYFQVPAVTERLTEVAALKERLGYLYAALSTAFFGGMIPFFVLLATGKVAPGGRLREFWFYLLFWVYKGVEIDALYRGQAALFGDEPSVSVIAVKTAFDQFVYNPLWGAPTQALCFLWKDSGFSFAKTRLALVQVALWRRALVILVSTWCIWGPAMVIIYSLPGALQLPLCNLVLCFWCLLLSFVSRDSAPEPLTR